MKKHKLIEGNSKVILDNVLLLRREARRLHGFIPESDFHIEESLVNCVRKKTFYYLNNYFEKIIQDE